MISARISQYPQYLFLNQKFNFCFVPLKPPRIADIGGIQFYAICNFVNGSSEPILLKNSKITVSDIFAIGVRYRKPPMNLLALAYRSIRVEMIAN